MSFISQAFNSFNDEPLFLLDGTSTTAANFSPPSHQNGDFLIALVSGERFGSTSSLADPGTPTNTGWTTIFNQDYLTQTGPTTWQRLRVCIFGRIANSSNVGSINTSSAPNGRNGACLRIRYTKNVISSYTHSAIGLTYSQDNPNSITVNTDYAFSDFKDYVSYFGFYFASGTNLSTTKILTAADSPNTNFTFDTQSVASARRVAIRTAILPSVPPSSSDIDLGDNSSDFNWLAGFSLKLTI